MRYCRLPLLFVVLFLSTIDLYAEQPESEKRIVVLTFDDAVRSHIDYVGPLLKEYGFGATFYICEYRSEFSDKTKYMTWQQIKTLSDMGFEIGNHTKTHTHVNKMSKEQFVKELEYIEQKCGKYNIPHPTTFAYPGYDTHLSAFDVLDKKGYSLARIGGSRTYQPGKDDPMLIPSFSTTGTDKQRVLNALKQARNGHVVVLTIHGVPDTAHPHVNTPPELFKEYLQFLHDNDFTVIAMRDLEKYCDISCTKQVLSPQMLKLEGDLKVHDPAIIKEDDMFYLFSTGGRRRGGLLPVRCSKDMMNWSFCDNVFDSMPEWTVGEIPGSRGIWAPDITFFNGRYHLYYSVSRFGKNTSAIGLVTNKTLNPKSADYEWSDHGLVVRSTEGIDDFNAIDANIVIENDQRIWICWGSFWSGIKMKRIDPKTGKPFVEDDTVYSLASRPPTDAIEAPYIVRHGKYWYLFVSFDYCCRGANSTYKIMVGRSKDITGPYIDRDGKSMLKGGGTLVLEATTNNWKGPGHCSILQDDNVDYMVFHAYHGETGQSELKISTILWKNGWPQVAELP